MSTLTDAGRGTGNFLVSEEDKTRSRDEITLTVPANTTMYPGTVLAKVASSGKYVAYDDAVSDGGENAAGILYEARTNDTDSAADTKAVVINADAEVVAADLVWGEGVDEAAGLVELLALGIKARAS